MVILADIPPMAAFAIDGKFAEGNRPGMVVASASLTVASPSQTELYDWSLA